LLAPLKCSSCRKVARRFNCSPRERANPCTLLTALPRSTSPDPNQPRNYCDRQQCQRHAHGHGPDAPSTMTSCASAERRRANCRGAIPWPLRFRFLHEQQWCRPAVQGRDAHPEMLPDRPTRPRLSITRCPLDTRAAKVRSRVARSAVRAACRSSPKGPPRPGVSWRRCLISSWSSSAAAIQGRGSGDCPLRDRCHRSGTSDHLPDWTVLRRKELASHRCGGRACRRNERFSPSKD
jgi:hypothetical protein